MILYDMSSVNIFRSAQVRAFGDRALAPPT